MALKYLNQILCITRLLDISYWQTNFTRNTMFGLWIWLCSACRDALMIFPSSFYVEPQIIQNYWMYIDMQKCVYNSLKIDLSYIIFILKLQKKFQYYFKYSTNVDPSKKNFSGNKKEVLWGNVYRDWLHNSSS